MVLKFDICFSSVQAWMLLLVPLSDRHGMMPC